MFFRAAIVLTIGAQLAASRSISAEQSAGEPAVVRLMSFNTWNSGMHVDRGLQKIADHIVQAGADIVALQELMYPGLTSSLLQYLGSDWTGVERRAEGRDWPGLGIVTKFKLDRTSGHQTNHSVGATVLVRKDPHPEVKFRIWSFHANFTNYGPYNACSPMEESEKLRLIKHSEEIRTADIKQVLRAIDRHQPDQGDQPVLILGDFNEPSHLDWTEETKDVHCGLGYDWPVSQLLLASGFKDAYRTVKPNPILYPGITWSTVQKFMEFNKTQAEPQDRIDFIYYRGGSIRPIDASVYSGTQVIAPLPYIDGNDWPSDHFSVVADFQLIL